MALYPGQVISVHAQIPMNSAVNSQAPTAGSSVQGSQSSGPVPAQSLIATLKGPFDPQDASPLFTTFPPEIRNRIFIFALLSYDDKSRPFPENAYHYRPGYHYRQLISTALLATCRRIYSETHDIPLSLNEHVFWCSASRGPGVRFSENPNLYFNQMTADQRKAIVNVHIFAQLFWLEGIFRRACDHINARRLKITVRHTDWWWWESNHPLVMKAGWGNNLKAIKDLEELEVELEAIERDKAQLEAIVKTMNKWQFDLDGGKKLTADGNDIVRDHYLGQGSFGPIATVNDIVYAPNLNKWSHPPRKRASDVTAIVIPRVPYIVSTLRYTTAKSN
ncbi:hypothetical protein BDN70DRAFT_870710 [Pholiota conissans]|uniref:Uncharacterized protein n=1 Tax=Pholiota conissans TaxID=109636 RepID=A0A9P5ZFQ7_9AGAR|nr:hypothetical protein BDN70DRAFT_870710 [Pholiota conissans]